MSLDKIWNLIEQLVDEFHELEKQSLTRGGGLKEKLKGVQLQKEKVSLNRQVKGTGTGSAGPHVNGTDMPASELAPELGIHFTTLHQWKDAGCPVNKVSERRYTFNKRRVVAWARANNRKFNLNK